MRGSIELGLPGGARPAIRVQRAPGGEVGEYVVTAVREGDGEWTHLTTPVPCPHHEEHVAVLVSAILAARRRVAQ